MLGSERFVMVVATVDILTVSRASSLAAAPGEFSWQRNNHPQVFSTVERHPIQSVKTAILK